MPQLLTWLEEEVMQVNNAFDVWALGRLIHLQDTAEARMALSDLSVSLNLRRDPKGFNNIAEGFWSTFLPTVKWEFVHTRLIMNCPVATIFKPLDTQKNLVNAASWDEFSSVWTGAEEVDITIFAGPTPPVFSLIGLIKPGWTVTLVRPNTTYDLLMKGDRWEDICIDPFMTELCKQYAVESVMGPIKGAVDIECFGVTGPVTTNS